MERRTLGRTGLQVSVLSFGCGAVGGLMVRGTAADQERAVARAIDLGINYFDTAPMYGNGESERNLGRVLTKLGRKDVYVGTKVWITEEEKNHIGDAVAASLEASLQRLRQESVDLFQLHNAISVNGEGDTLDPQTVFQEVLPALERLRQQGKARFIGFTALGDTIALQRVVAAGTLDTAQISYNLLNPSAGSMLPNDYPAQDYGNVISKASERGMGTIGIRVLAGGALSAVETRHPLGMPVVEPIGSGANYGADVRRAQRLQPLVTEGYAESLIAASLRFVISNRALTTTLVGLSTPDQLEYAAASANKGPLSPQALRRVAELQHGFVGEQR